MTSLISPPILDLSVSYDCDSTISLYNVWKVTNHECLKCKQASLLRLNNRSWRLLNEKLLRCTERKIDHSYLNLNSASLDSADLHTTKVSHPMMSRPSLFLNHSKSTQESHLSLHLHPNSVSVGMEPFDSGDETSDISEDDEYDYSDQDDVLYDSSEESHCNHRQTKQSRFVDHSSEPLASPKAGKTSATSSRQNSTSKAEAKNIFFIEHSPSPPENDEAASTDSCTNPPHTSGGPFHIKRQDSLFGANDLSANLPSNDLSGMSSTDISEDDEYNLILEDDDDDVVPQVLMEPTTKLSSGISKSTNEDNESEWMSISSDSEQVNDSPRTQPLTFAKVKPGRSSTVPNNASFSDVTRKPSPVSTKPRSLLSGLFLSSMANSSAGSPTSSKSLSTYAPPKPVLKRSSTTGVITVDKNNRARDQSKMLKASIIFSKRYASLSDISKKMSQYRSPVLFVEEEETTGDGKDKDFSKDHGESLLAKQTSSVELSNFMATANPSMKVNYGGPVKSAHKSPTHDALEGNLSSSLNKYSSLYPSAGSSFKNILSKSSLNISSLFGLNKMGKLKPLSHTNRSSENVKSPKHVDPLPSLFAGYLSQQNSHDALEVYQDVYSKTTPSKSIKVAPNPIKDFEPSVEISESLKDSLMIDHKLGKIPLPERVISDHDLFHGKDRQAFVDDSNDYYSKGW